jgi:hypothetical protein
MPTNTNAAAMSADTLIDLVQRLGVVDIVVNNLRSRIAATDVDALMEDATDYLRRNPEMIVVGLGTLTLAAAAVVFLTDRSEEIARPVNRPRAARPLREDIDTTPVLGRTTPSTPTARPRSSTSASRRNTAPRE